jgi:hypothetical protein
LERFIKGGCYVVVKVSDWKAFAGMCDAAGITWGGRREKVSEYEPAPLKQGRPIRVFAFGGRLRWAPVNSPKSIDMPIIGFQNLRPLTEIADRVVITSDWHTITARLIAEKRTIKTAAATCSPEDIYRFGPGALLAMFRALETDADRTLAMNLIAEERVRQLEPEIPNVRDLVGMPKHGAPLAADKMGAVLAEALSNIFGAEVVVVNEGELRKGKSPIMRLIGETLKGGAKAGAKA